MMNYRTNARLAELGNTLVSASGELDKLIRELSEEADRQLEEAARAFSAQYAENHDSIWADYRRAHEELLKASIAASNIHELRERAFSLANKCGWWTILGDLDESKRVGRIGQNAKDITLVIEKMLRANSEQATK